MPGKFTFKNVPFRDEYRAKHERRIEKWFSGASAPVPDLQFSFETSAVFSSNIEGNTVDINSYMNQKQITAKFKPVKEIEEIKDLVGAYSFARENALTEINFLNAHKLLSKSFLIKSKRGKYRDDRMGVFSTKGLVYLAVEPEFLPAEMGDFRDGVNELINLRLDTTDVFYFASLCHLRLAQLHPFFDGNGRIARLFEKWFIASALGEKAWSIQSERYYKENRDQYYKNIDLGVNYYELDFSRTMPFLEMLPNSLTFFESESK